MLLHGNANGRLLPPVWKGGRSLQKALPVGAWERVNDSDPRVNDSDLRVNDSGPRVNDSDLRVNDSGPRVNDSDLRADVFGLKEARFWRTSIQILGFKVSQNGGFRGLA
jgi:hypothetical protein